MAAYIILSRISPEAFSDPFEFKKIADTVASKIKSECPGVVWKESYSTTGRFDVVDIVESDDPKQITNAAMIIRSYGHSTTETLVATPWKEFIEKPSVRDRLLRHPGDWSHYLRGVFARLQIACPGRKLKGMNILATGDIPVAGGTTAVSAPLLYPYYPRQMLGLMGGLKGAAEYEAALVAGYPEYEQVYQRAIAIMGPQAIAHLVIIIFIIIGNITFFVEKKRSKKSV